MAKLIINLRKYERNLHFLSDLLHQEDRTIMAVTKVFCADQHLVDVINATPIEYIADSRIANLKKMKTSKSKVLLRIPALSEVDQVIDCCDLSLNSEFKVIEALSLEAKKKGKTHRIILMFDIGDLREGIYYDSIDYHQIKRIKNLPNIQIEGIGTNITCYGGVIPSVSTYRKLVEIKTEIEHRLNLKLKIISGGNSSAIPMLKRRELDPFINNIRIGEAFALGRETAYGETIEGMADDAFLLSAEIIELKEKPSMPEGELGLDAFGNPVSFIDRGIMMRAILDVGKQDVDPSDLIPPDGVEILGASSDHLLVWIKEGQVKLGQNLSFKLTYGGLLRLATSPYIEKIYENL